MIAPAFLKDHVFKKWCTYDQDLSNACISEAYALKLRGGRVGCSVGSPKAGAQRIREEKNTEARAEKQSSTATIENLTQKARAAAPKHRSMSKAPTAARAEKSDGPEEPEQKHKSRSRREGAADVA